MFRLVCSRYLREYRYSKLPLVKDEEGNIETVEEGRKILQEIALNTIKELEEEIAYWKTVPNLPMAD